MAQSNPSNNLSTLFVLPLDEKYVCPLHKGVLEDPVLDAGGRSVCRACQITHNKENGIVSSNLISNPSLQEEINSLLCYCKYGVARNANNELIPTPNNKGCSHIVKYASRLQHEATCAYSDKDFLSIVNPGNINATPSNEKPSIPTTLPSADTSASELRKLLEERDARIATLEQEVVTLREKLQETEHPAAAFAKRTADGTRELIEDLLRLIVEDIPNGIAAARTTVVTSPPYQKSSEALASFKEKVVEKAHTVGQQAADLHPVDRLITALVELRDELVSNSHAIVQNVKHVIAANTRSAPLLVDNTPSSTLASSQDDPEFQASLQRSVASFEEEERARQEKKQVEQATLAAATAASMHAETITPGPIQSYNKL